MTPAGNKQRQRPVRLCELYEAASRTQRAWSLRRAERAARGFSLNTPSVHGEELET